MEPLTFPQSAREIRHHCAHYREYLGHLYIWQLAGNLTSSLESFVKSLLTVFEATHQNITLRDERSQKTMTHDDIIGAVTFIMVFIAIFSLLIVSVLVIAVRSRSYDQLEEQYFNSCNMVVSEATDSEYFQGPSCLIHENRTAD